ncbi:MAG TPA: hypothetical protein VGH89_07325 [Pseudonocardia sp.]|jgi:hypothetical protein
MPPWQRVLRAGIFAAVCVPLTAAGHGLVGAVPVGNPRLAAGGCAVFLLAVWAGGREWSRAGIISGLLAGQLGLHVLFSLGRPDGMATSMPGMAGMPNMPGMPGMSPAGSGGPAHLMGDVAAMVGVHLLAAVVAGWWLACGEALLWQMARGAARAARSARAAVGILTGTGPAGPWPPVRSVVTVDAHGPAPTTIPPGCVSRRGPPRARLTRENHRTHTSGASPCPRTRYGGY